MTPLDHFKQSMLSEQRRKYPNVPEHLRTVPKFTDRTANGLTKMIIAFLNAEGWQAERISTTGRMIDQRKTYTDVVGFRRTIGSVKWIKGSGTKGSADVSSVISGKSVKIEIKIGRDRQSESQRQYQAAIERAGGVYWIAKDWAGFYELYSNIIN
jgi:hypothetical protein